MKKENEKEIINEEATNQPTDTTSANDSANQNNEIKKEKSAEKKEETKKKENKPTAEEILTQKNSELNDKLLRTMAEFENYKKRTAREKEDMASFCKASCIEGMLSAIDNFERALTAECKDDDFKKGMEMIFNQLISAIKNLGAVEIDALGKQFDPQLHNAIKQIQSDDFGENEVCEVFQKGYMLGDRVIRHAMVVVANP